MKKISREIFKEFKKAKRVLCPLHLNPDGDSVASALAMYYLLSRMGKKIRVTSSDKLSNKFSFLKDCQKVEIKDFTDLDLTKFDLILFLDISSLNRFTKENNFNIPENIITINIDHHDTNVRFANINAVFPEIGSTCQILYEFFKFQGIKIDKNISDLLYCGIYTDTGGLEFAASVRTHEIMTDLLRKGANHNEIVFQLERKLDIRHIKSWGEILENLKIDVKHRFCWSTISYDDILKIGCDPTDYHGATEYIKMIKGTDFGFILAEQEPNNVRGDLRSRRQPEEEGFDVSQIAVALGGGGHKAAAGFELKMDLNNAEKTVLKTARKFAKKH